MSEQNFNKSAEASSIIKNHVVWSMGGGAIPIPFVDVVAVTAIQLDMIKQLARVYSVDYKETEGKAIVTALTGSALASIGKRALKFIPGIGSVLGGITMAAMSGASTYALGEVFSKHFETGGTFLDFDPSRLKKYYDEKFEKGKEFVEDLKKENSEDSTTDIPDDPSDPSFVEPVPSPNMEEEDVVQQLKDLAQLKKDGVITEKEFKALKKKIIGEATS